jgi:hypothetical protein
LRWALELSRETLDVRGDVAAVEVLKFQKVISPGGNLRLSLRYAADSKKLHFHFSSERGRISSGRIVLR